MPLRELSEAAVAAYVRLERGAALERRVEAQMIADCVADKSAMPEHAWERRHVAEEKSRAAKRLVEALALAQAAAPL